MNRPAALERSGRLSLRWPHGSLRAYLVAAMLVATVPLALLLSFQIYAGVRAQQAQLDQDLAHRALALAQAVERELRTPVASPPAPPGPAGDSAPQGTPGQPDALGRWRALLQAAQPPTDGFLVLTDGRQRLTAGTPSADADAAAATLGTSAAGAAGRQGGLLRTALSDGGSVRQAWQRTLAGGWVASAGVRTDAFDRAQDLTVLRAVFVVAASLLLGIALASLLARRLVQPLARLARDDVDATGQTSPVLEIELLRERLRSMRADEAAARQRLETKAAEFQALFESSPVALAFAQDKQCRHVVHNAAMDALFGGPADGSGTALTVLHAGQPLPRELQPLQRAARTGEAVPAMELEVTAPGLPSKVVLAHAVPLFDPLGRPRGAIGAAVDITPRKEAEALLLAADHDRALLVEHAQAARVEAERANQAKDEFLAMLGHELRNPLGAISSAMEVLVHPNASPALAAGAREIAARQTRNLTRMLDDVLDVARVVSGKIMLARQPLDWGALVQRVVATLQIGGNTRQHTVALDLRPLWVEADATRIEQVVTNLLHNALKYTPAGSQLGLSLRQEQADAVLRVSDNGPGIAPALLPNIFDLFVQGERGLDRRAGGLGVGLTLVRRLVELHGGSVQAHSSELGSLFEVRLPVVEPPPPAPTTVAMAPGARPTAPRRVVLIEDNADAALALQSRLELDGHQVQCAADGITGLDLLLSQWPDVAVVDIGLPGLTGLQVALRSRAAGFPGLMLAVSGYGQEADNRRALQSGFDALLVKPVDPVQLRSWLDRAG